MTDRVLVIKHGALGDFVMATGPFRAIRAHHPDGWIVLLTTAPYAELGRMTGWFDEVWEDPRAGPRDLRALWRLAHMLRRPRFTHVYDLQTSDRSSIYHRLMPRPKPLWSGVARGASHPDRNPERGRIHTIDRQREQLRQAGLEDAPPPSLDWARADISRFGLDRAYALLAPGGSAHRPRKRWPIGRYAELARRLADRGLKPVVIGGADERELGRVIPVARDLTGQTSIPELAELARGAFLAVGNDTGPMHVCAVAGCPSIVLFSGESDPARTAPRGPAVRILRREPLGSVSVDEVWALARPA
jgi:ADP-heptose:LPS heptosyltransferase